MCWVMPPASPATTSVSRIASSSDVLPWSTWPMIVTTGGRVDEVLVGVLELGLVVDLVGRVDDLDLLVELVGEDLDRVVGQRLGERRHLAQLHQLLDDLGDRHAEVLGDVLDGRAGVDADRVGLQDCDCPAGPARRRRRGAGGRRGAAGGAGAAAGPGRRRAAGTLAARGLRVDDDAADAAAGAGGALALERGARRALGAALSPPAGPAWLGGLRRRLRGVWRGRSGRRPALCWAPSCGAVALRAARRQRAIRGVLVDGRGGGLDLDAGIGQPLQHLG